MEKNRKRGERRDQTTRYAKAARHTRIQTWGRSSWAERPLGRFAKGKSIGCRCRRHPPGQPKLPGGLCHAGGKQHPCVGERIAGHRLTMAWTQRLRGAWAPDDIEL